MARFMTPRITRVKKHVHSHGPLSSVLAGAVGFGGGWSLAQAAEGLARVTHARALPGGPVPVLTARSLPVSF